jgi:hypothetical protein
VEEGEEVEEEDEDERVDLERRIRNLPRYLR